MEFDRQCSTERRHDPLTIMDGVNRIVSVRSGAESGAFPKVSCGIHSEMLNEMCPCFWLILVRGRKV